MDSFHSLHEAKSLFEEHYVDKSGNLWKMRDNFEKCPGKMYPIDIDYGADDNVSLETDPSVPSKLKVPIQELVKLIFDVKIMKKLMAEFELDTEKMPLGK